MKEENPVYFGLGYYEFIESRKSLLSSEMSLLNIIKIIRRYNSLRTEELQIKSRMHKAAKELDLQMKKTRSSFPFLKIPQKAKREEVNKKENIIRKDNSNNDLEYELREIQERLRSIEG